MIIVHRDKLNAWNYPLKDRPSSLVVIVDTIERGGRLLSSIDYAFGIYCLLIDTITMIRILCALYNRNYSP